MSQNNLNKKNYRALKFMENQNDLLDSADICRKSLFLFHEASSKSMDNASTCELLSQKLGEYTEKVISTNGNSIYADVLEKRCPEIKSQIKFRTDPDSLKNLDLASLMKDLGCKSDSNKLYCKQSENITDAEFGDFVSLYNPLKKQTHKKHAVFNKPYGPYTANSNKTNPSTSSNCAQSKPDHFNEKNKSYKRSTDFTNHFKTAKEELDDQNFSKYGANSNNYEGETSLQRPKKVGLARRSVKCKFISPLLSRNGSSEEQAKAQDPLEVLDERLKNIDPKMVELIRAEIMDHGSNVHWDDIAGLKQAKMAIQEAVVWPMLRPDIFTGLRRPPRGILLFGPPGTGKTLIAKCVASQSKSTFFSISASSLTSKWIGDGEKMVRALFAVARVHQPAVIFIDEVDSLLTQRSDTEHESSRRIKTEFLVHLDGAATNNEDRILLIGATNRPQELDEAARRRFVKRLYIPLPEYEARLQLLKRLVNNEKHCLAEEEFGQISEMLDGYSGADIQNFCSEASLEPIRCIDFGLIEKIQAHEVRPLNMEDFQKAFKRIRPSVSQDDLTQYIVWNNTYGSGSHQ